MRRAAVHSVSDHAAEYAVYTFGVLEQDRVNPRMWEKKASHAAMSAALGQAEDLYRTGQYMKVEIKQKYFDRKQNRNIDMTLKTLGQTKTTTLHSAVAIVFAMLCGIAAFGFTLLQLGG